MDVTITNEQKVKLTLAPKTASGDDATLDGVPAWNKVSGEGEIEAATDGLSAYLISSDEAGSGVFEVIADADLGQGTRELKDTINLTTTAAAASELGIVVGEPEPKDGSRTEGGAQPRRPR
jgi:hypothetical protein